MSPSRPLVAPFEALAGSTAEEVGGKALNLALMAAAGLPVPHGFAIASDAFRQARHASTNGSARLSDSLSAEVKSAYAALGRGLVAVRSSATNEDGSQASFAGQQETILGVDGDAALVAAVERCWASLDSERAVAYRREQKIADDAAAMAVVVQRLVPSDVSGVLFTHDPLDPTGQQMLVEAAWGLGEAVVSGRVQPDRFHVVRATGVVVDQQIHTKPIRITAAGEEPVPPEQQSIACLSPEQLIELAAVGRRIEAYYGEPRDIEWAIAEGKLWVLQARPITAAAAFEVEELRRAEVAKLTSLAEEGGTVWAKYNLAEVLPEPTPLTWSIIRRFMSGRGGFGQMYRDLGFDPDPAIDDAGIFDLVCGRPYVNLSREPRMFFRDFPYGHDFETLKANPEKAIYPTPGPLPGQMTWRFWWRLPWILGAMYHNQSQMLALRETCAAELRDKVFPEFAAKVAEARKVDLAKLSPRELLDFAETWRKATLDDFARHSLRPSMLAAAALAELEQGLSPPLEPEKAAEEVRSLIMGVHPPEGCDLAGALKALAAGEMPRAAFLSQFGHRAPGEMELAQPRWSEAGETLPVAGQGDRGAGGQGKKEGGELGGRWETLLLEARISPQQRGDLEPTLKRAREFVGLREAGKHYLLLGYALLRAALVELDRRLRLDGGLFYLEYDELPRLVAGEDFAVTIARRKKERKLLLGIVAPPVIFSDDLDAIGRPIALVGASELVGTPVSFGVYEGEALVLEHPIPAETLPPGFILVCPSTDPAWVPLFLRAKALVMETGGVLSHGAIVAREFGIPAVAGLPNIHRRLQTGQKLRVDGTTGKVHVW